ncbi:hypothetical protein IW140_006111 [Coemansia sp. RSA 1813]|nr:hypothetical protein EV178_006070 [Coemansia sp. RSA 1646]KAJ1765437.1 hypothetical protein LPJ74_006351 [Coemansia sp. RSA 1843]KAJ2085881.1 hypothetical protein IW138_006051 [Coemansia sp. RSA 986]KAJ2210719.1 hypothetical protein EV179_006047 [Coemansia sp. RSA 487]KAJ2563452.1 hypothetical protein IW140_006111 [Coemansia sp. RSA 1813]
MRGATLYRFLAVALLALLCLANPSLAQNDNSGGNTDASTESTATKTDNENTSTPTPSKSRSSGDASEDGSKSGDSGSTSSENNKSRGNSSDEPTSADDNNSDEDPSESFDESYEETGMPGTVSLQTPNLMTIPTPMFAIGDQVVLGWNYSSDTLRPPEKLSICGSFPTGSSASTDSTQPCNWYIAQDIPGNSRNYTWDTVTQGAPGVAFSEGSGYRLYFFDSAYGVSNSSPGAGRITPTPFWFNMYRSRYGLTNDGVPAGYNPSAATAVAIHAWTVVVGIALSIVCVMA